MGDCVKFSNEAISFLVAGISDSDTSITVTSFAGFPATAPYRIRIDEEIMMVTGGAATLTWTVSRGMEGTTAEAHFAGAEIGNYFTAGSLEDFYQCMFMSDVRANLPSPGTPGRLFFTQKPGWYFFRDNGTSWDAWGALFAMFEPLEEDFKWINQTTATLSASSWDEDGGIYISTPPLVAPGENVRLRTQKTDAKIPVAPPYKITSAFTPLLPPSNNTSCGIVFRDSTTGQFIFFRLIYDTTSLAKRSMAISIDKYDNETTFNSNYFTGSAGIFNSSLIWFRMEDDGTDLIWSFSNDGNNYIELHSEARTDFLSCVDEIGFAVNTNNTTDKAAMTLLSWEKTE